jgi:hypothetical protein
MVPLPTAPRLIRTIILSAMAMVVLVAIRLATGMSWSDILRDRNFNNYVVITTLVVFVIVFAIFFFVNNGFFR